ncbi:hypothetical protein J7438_25760 [Thalassotalea sp. G20_0]|uniref:hypothetical protein n=1 Tax=Thalassotalea sp. G20_0 TaxID=2821093 RepID=UPI001ADD27BE|nr:hypothetical protein [Thalassotalea sp. G20_0]MBO9497465.1 hypothetical protein [Thalassotalea sp. G20_0]
MTLAVSELGQVCRAIVKQALQWYELPDSESAIRLLCMIAAHESGDFHYIKQINGPALGIFQMEPATYDDVVAYIKHNQERFVMLAHDLPNPAEYMAFNPVFGAAIGRVYLLRIPEQLPQPFDIDGLAQYAKDHWNTYLGAAQWKDYRDAWLKHYS